MTPVETTICVGGKGQAKRVQCVLRGSLLLVDTCMNNVDHVCFAVSPLAERFATGNMALNTSAADSLNYFVFILQSHKCAQLRDSSSFPLFAPPMHRAGQLYWHEQLAQRTAYTVIHPTIAWDTWNGHSDVFERNMSSGFKQTACRKNVPHGVVGSIHISVSGKGGFFGTWRGVPKFFCFLLRLSVALAVVRGLG